MAEVEKPPASVISESTTVFRPAATIRFLVARFLGPPVRWVRCSALTLAHLGIIGWTRNRPAMLLWNDGSYLPAEHWSAKDSSSSPH
jgi:hypothetical protein